MTTTPRTRQRVSKKHITISQIKQAINRFISRTQKIVRKVKPGATILLSNQPKTSIRKRKGKALKVKKLQPARPKIQIPNCREIRLSDIPNTCSSPQNTDDETFAYQHEANEHVEALLRFKPELRRIKANERSTKQVHFSRKTQENLQANLTMLALFVPDVTIDAYKIENSHLVRYPEEEPADSLIVKFDI